MKLIVTVPFFGLVLAVLSCEAKEPSPLPKIVPWDVGALTSNIPEVQWLDTASPRKVRPLTYPGDVYRGKPTRVFAWYASPTTLGVQTTTQNYPGIVLVHGGGGRAFEKWAELWAKRGYAAIAMDLAGCGVDGKRIPDGGPGQTDAEKFGVIENTMKDRWTYHAVGNVIRAHSLLRSFEEVKGQKTALTGISWGGYLTCIVSGLDQRFSVTMPVYGCGFLRDNSVWKESQFSKMAEQDADSWHAFWDPSQYVGAATMPVLFVNGTNDFAYPMDSYAKTCALVTGEKNYSIQLKMPHGHLFEFPEFFGFVDQYLLGTTPMAVVSRPSVSAGKLAAIVKAATKLVSARLHYTTGSHRSNKDRAWMTVALDLDGNTITGPAPPKEATVWYVDVRDNRKLLVSSELMVPEPENPPSRR
ncbi:MAG: alpha/beta fold hydrolase [Verrucomicrobiaceae bacterium]|nr:alpha/beta fold hydrolase [Verrucomicrobiaceae bacterium]